MLEYEFRKILTQRKLMFMICGLFVIYIVLYASTIGNYQAHTPPGQDVSRLFAEYFENPDSVQAYFDQREQIIQEYRDITHDMTPHEAQAYGKLDLPDRYSSDEAWSDDGLFNLLRQQEMLVRGHPELLQGLIASANNTLKEFDYSGVPSTSYAYRLQVGIISTYTQVLKDAPALGFEYIYGWDLLFSAGLMDVFIVLAVIMISTVVFSQERVGGFYAILRATKNGRRKAVVAKLGTAFLACLLIVLGYVAITLVMIGSSVGFSNGRNFVQTMSTYQYAPVALRMVEYFGVWLLIKLLGALLLSAVVLLISCRTTFVAQTYITSIAFYAVGYLFAGLPSDSFFCHFSIVNVLSGDMLLQKARFLNLFGYPVSYAVLIPVLYGVALILCCLFIFHLFCATDISIIRSVKWRGFKELHQLRRDRRSGMCRARSLFYFETKKSVLENHLAWVGIILISLQIMLSVDAYTPYQTETESLYCDYLSVVQGPVTEKNRLYLETEKEKIAAGIRNAESATELYRQGMLDEQEYQAIMNEYYYALHHEAAFEKIWSQLMYADAVLKEKEIAISLINPSAWTQFFEQTTIVPILIWTVLVAAGMFPVEYHTTGQSMGFGGLLRSTKKGRQETFSAKVVATLLLTTIGFITFSTCSLIVFFLQYGIRNTQIPLLSLPNFSSLHTDLSIGEYLSIYFAVRFCGVLVLSLFVLAVSEWTRNILSALCVSTGWLLLPTAMVMAGLENARYINHLAYMQCSPAFRLSAEKWIWGYDMSLLLLFLGVAAIMTFVSVYAAKRHYAYK